MDDTIIPPPKPPIPEEENENPEEEAAPPIPILPRKQPLPRKTKVIIGAGSLVAVALLSYAAYAYHQQTNRPLPAASGTPVPSASAAPTPTPTPSLVPSKLDGAMVGPGRENLHPLAVMIENHPDARPQSGLGEASLVYEAIAEGGITRFMAVYADPAEPVRVGPVRSARPYYVDLAAETKAFFAHVGGSVDGLNQIKADSVLDIDGLSLGPPLFVRDLSRNVALEHTMYSSTDTLWQYATGQQNWSKAGDSHPCLFQYYSPLAARPATQKISVSVSDPLYATEWHYDQASNSYLRFMAGSPHTDADTGKQIAVKDIVLQTVQKSDYTETYGSITKPVTRMDLIGSGPAVIFQNGQAIKATWKKQGNDRTRYFADDGKEIAFVRGEIWVQLVHPDSQISY